MPQAGAAEVAGYILGPDGHVLSTLRLPEIEETPRLLAWLERAKRSAAKPGPALARPAPQSLPPQAKADALVLHLTARYLSATEVKRPSSSGGGDDFDRYLALVLERLRAVSRLPAEDWVVLDKTEWVKLLPPADAQVGSAWDIDPEVADKLLRYFRPSTTNNDPSMRKLVARELKATLLSVENGVARAR